VTNNSLLTQCKRIEVELPQDNESIHNFLQPSLLSNIQECHCVFTGKFVACVVLLQFLSLPQLKLLHIRMNGTTVPIGDPTDKCTELEKFIELNSTLQEMNIIFHVLNKIPSTIISLIKGVTRNKAITSLTLNVSNAPALPDRVIGQLLKGNKTLKALSLNISDCFLTASSLNIVEVNTPLAALEIGPRPNNKLVTSLLPHFKKLHCLMLHVPYPPNSIFLSHPSLHTLTLPLDTAESAIELFTILQTNTTLKALRVS
uniref:Uncharacterized protein n=1 Tax=Amphimedon queenslandica TaxID=400682 RepID=A0A1X7U2L7_AMPQE